jgi:hypothetical protein
MSALSLRASLGALGLLLVTLGASPHAQVAGRNVNMVTGGTFPGGDPFLQKQNEPSIAMSTRNPCHLLAGANDYRAVNLPGLPDDLEIGDSWVGWYESTDCGATWYSTLVPGYPQDNTPEGIASPAKGFTTAADPVLKSGAAGTFYYLFIAFNRGSNVGNLSLARFIDHNDRELFIDPDELPNVADRHARSPIKYVGTSLMAKGSGGRFVDKPSLAAFPATTGTCTMDGETVPATNVYVAWSEFIGNNPDNQKSKVMFARSANCGLTLAEPATKLSEGFPLGSGTAIAVNPTNPNDIYVVWRQIRNSKQADAILFARSTDGGRSFTKANPVPGLGEGVYAPFDQNTTSPAIGSLTQTFRTVGFPAVTFGDDGFLYLAVSQVPGGPLGTLGGAQARITLTRTNNGTTWETPVAVVGTGAAGQQFMPALAYAAGKLQLIWYDVRFDESEQTQTTLVDEVQAITASQHRRTIDLLGAQASLPSTPWPPVFQPYGVSQPDYDEVIPGTPPVRPLNGPRISQYLIGDPLPNSVEGAGPRQLKFNRANLLLYGGGSIPFMGDYIDVAPIQFLPDGTGKWLFNGVGNASNTALGTFQAAWTDNRDARVGNATVTPPNDPKGLLNYTPPRILPAGMTIDNSACPPDGADNTQTRDANVYTSRITQDFSLTLPGNAKPTNTPGVVRAFAVQLANNLELTPGTTTPETPTLFRLTISNAPTTASFSRFTFLGDPQQGCQQASPPVHTIDVNVLPRSSVVRTVYVTCGGAATRIVVTATRMINPTTPGPTASVVINPDPSNQATKGPDGSPLGPESHTPDAENPDAENPDAENPDAENPDAENPDAENPDAENPDAENPDAENPDAENPDAENPDAENPDAENANPKDVQDVSADITNDGDTTSGYQVQAQTSSAGAGYSFLLMARRVYSTPTSINCNLVRERRNQILFAIPLTVADLAPQDFFAENDPSEKHPTILVRPGESIRVTLRIVRDTTLAMQPFCSPDPNSPDYCFNKIVIRTQAQAPNSGDTEPEEDFVGAVPSVFLAFTSQPTDAFTNTTIDGSEGPVSVRAVDDSDEPIQGLEVTMSLGSNPGDTSLGGTVTQLTNADGFATFSDLTIDNDGDGYTLLASAAGAESVESDPFDIIDANVVVNTNNVGPGSFRQALEDANSTEGHDVIAFNIPGAGPHTISVQGTALPMITGPVTIDGLSQPGSSPNSPRIVLTRDADLPGVNGLQLAGANSVVRGLVINNFATGLFISSSGNTIQSNFIGTLADGSTALGNAQGIAIGASAQKNLIGGTVLGQRNIIGGNSEWGIGIAGDDNIVRGNLIGDNPGIEFGPNGAPNGTGFFTSAGIMLLGGAANNQISGLPDGTFQNAILNNNGKGASLSNGGVAGVGPAESGNAIRLNQIDGNAGLGIDLGNDGITDNDLGSPDPPVPPDTDIGPNDFQNTGELSAAVIDISDNALNVDGTFTSTPSTTFVVDYYVSGSCNIESSTDRDGRTWIGSQTHMTDGGGTAAINGFATVPSGVFASSWLTVTVTNPGNSTSEFSNCVQILTTP